MKRLNSMLMTALSAGLAPIMLVVPALFLRYGVDRPATAGSAAVHREPEPALAGVG